MCQVIPRPDETIESYVERLFDDDEVNHTYPNPEDRYCALQALFKMYTVENEEEKGEHRL